MKQQQKKFPPIFWVAFGLLAILNVVVFFGYQQPLERYQQFAKVKHVITVKAGGKINDIVRLGEQLPDCKIVNDGKLVWQSFANGIAQYVFQPNVAASPGKSNENAICQSGDLVKVDTTSSDNDNTTLVLLSIDFSNPLNEQ